MKNILSIFLNANDSALGRIDPTMLDEQTRMELFIDGLADETKQKYFKDSSGNYRDIKSWDCLHYYFGKLIVVDLPRDTYGTLAFEFLPSSVTGMEARLSAIEGTVPVDLLPRSLITLELSMIGQMHGTIDFRALPPALELLLLSDNSFTGTADLTALPKNLERLAIDCNEFFGSISLANLPDPLQWVSIHNNDFCGNICETKISDATLNLSASHCKFTGSFVYKNLPVDSESIGFSNNQLSGSLRIGKAGSVMEELDLSGNAFIGKALIHSSMHEKVYIGGNRITAVYRSDKIPCTMDADGFVKAIGTKNNEEEESGENTSP